VLQRAGWALPRPFFVFTLIKTNKGSMKSLHVQGITQLGITYIHGITERDDTVVMLQTYSGGTRFESRPKHRPS
jgi:hypothetical protein